VVGIAGTWSTEMCSCVILAGLGAVWLRRFRAGAHTAVVLDLRW
jgi:hypothetical protein